MVSRQDEIRARIQALFSGEGVSVTRDRSMGRALERCEREHFDVFLVTSHVFRGSRVEDLELIQILATKNPSAQILFLAEPGDIRMAMSALRGGTYQYLKMPVADEELRLLVETAIQERAVGSEELQEGQGPGQEPFEEMYGRSQAMQEVYRQVKQAAVTDLPVLLLGETGTGKDLTARAIHRLSERREGPFLAVNLGATPTELVASELFGHEKGSFTGALDKSIGKFEQANNGTIFLDEIGTIETKMQVSLLRLLEEQRFYRLGGKRAIGTNARIIAASNEDLAELVKKGAFREDLFYRLDVFRIHLPPLRERPGDILALIDAFVRRYNRDFGKSIQGFSPECLTALQSYPWPGNVRELKNAVQRGVVVCPGEVLLLEHLPPRFQKAAPVVRKVTFEIGATLEEVEREMILRTLAAVENNRKRCAEVLGISRRALYNRLRRHGLE